MWSMPLLFVLLAGFQHVQGGQSFVVRLSGEKASKLVNLSNNLAYVSNNKRIFKYSNEHEIYLIE